MIDTRRLVLLSAALLVGACTTADRPAAAKAPDAFPALPAGYIVDSILPIEEHLRRFRTGLTQVASMQGGADSEHELVQAFLAAVSTQDSITLSHLLLSREEFAWLYYPAHAYSRPPYELDPGSFWTLIRGNGGKGFTRLLREYGGHRLGYVTHGCKPSNAVQAPMREWNQCEVGLTRDGEQAVKRMFGSIVSIGGRYKFVSYANDL
ncbi:MAG: hypothetical protein ACJ8B6_13095 [Gemmatimonadales bacterium]